MDVAELAEAFKDQQHSAHQAQLMQRVQELMGQGIDVSSLFANIVSVRGHFCSVSSYEAPSKLHKRARVCWEILETHFFFFCFTSAAF